MVYYHDDSLFLTRLLMALTSHHASWERTIIISFPGNARRHPLNNLQFSSVETRSSSPRTTTTAHDPPSPRTSKKGFAANTDRGKCEPTLESESSTLPPQVEMRGIEPRSDSNATGLLRVQFAKEFLGLSVSRKLGRLEQAQSTKIPLIPIDKELKQWLSK